MDFGTKYDGQGVYGLYDLTSGSLITNDIKIVSGDDDSDKIKVEAILEATMMEPCDPNKNL